MWIAGLAPIVVGFALMLAAVVVLFAEVVGKSIVAVAELTWEAINPANHRRAVRQGT
jgi:hypothetical protein